MKYFGFRSSPVKPGKAGSGGYIFPMGDLKGFLGLRAYGEFDAVNRPSGWNTWLTFSVSQAAPTEATPSQHLITK